MAESKLDAAVAHEVVALHVEFEQWFRGDLDNLARVEAVLADDFTFVSPRGGLIDRVAVLGGLRSGRASRELKIRVENPVVRWQAGDVVVATYEEWHEHPDYSTTRLSTAVFSRDDAAPNGLIWRHVHETWITPPPNWVVPEPGS